MSTITAGICCPSSILNFRDIASVNASIGRDVVKRGFVYRSANPDGASLEDLESFQHRLHVTTTVDLRSGPKNHVDFGLAENQPQTFPKKYLVNLNGKSYQDALRKELTWPLKLKLANLKYVKKDRAECIRIVGKNIMSEKGLTGLAKDTLKASVREFREIFKLLAKTSNYPFYFFCQQGKDRTGLTMILLLLLLQVPTHAIESDYMLSASELTPERDTRLEELQNMGLPDSFVGCDPELVDEVEKWLAEEHGGIRGYLSQIGVTHEDQECIRQALLV